MVASVNQLFLAHAHPLEKNPLIVLSLGQGLLGFRRLLAEHGHFARRVVHLLGRLGEISQPMAQGFQVPRLAPHLCGQVANSLGAWLRFGSPLATAVRRRVGVWVLLWVLLWWRW